MKNRFIWLDAIRFLAATTVVVTHFIEEFIVRIYGFSDLSGIGTIECWMGILAVMCFFVLSGYVIAFSIHRDIQSRSFTLANYAKKRILRIYPVAWGALIFALIVICIMLMLGLPGLDDKGFMLAGDVWGEPNYIGYDFFLYSIFLPPVGFHGGFFNVALWTLSYEIGFYLIYGAIVASFLKFGLKRTIFWLAFIIFMSLTWYIIYILGNSTKQLNLVNAIEDFLEFFPCWGFIPFFCIWLGGVGLYFLNVKFNCFLKKLIFAALAIFVINIYLIHYLLGVPFNFNAYPDLSIFSTPDYGILALMNYSIIIFICLYMVMHIKVTPKLIKALAWCGKQYSFSLYAIHFVILNFAFSIFAYRLYSFNTADYVMLFIVLFITANITAYFFSKIFENRQIWHNFYNRLIMPKQKNDENYTLPL